MRAQGRAVRALRNGAGWLFKVLARDESALHKPQSPGCPLETLARNAPAGAWWLVLLFHNLRWKL